MVLTAGSGQRFDFPDNLNPDKANFRFVVEYRHFDAKDNPGADSKAIPGIDSYYECDFRKADDDRYVGPVVVGGNQPVNYGTFAQALNQHEASFVVSTAHLHSLNISVWDVDRKDVWDSILGALSNVASAFLGKLSDELPLGIGISDDVKGAIAKKIAGPSDRRIFSVSKTFGATPADGPQKFLHTSSEQGYAGDYEITLDVQTM